MLMCTYLLRIPYHWHLMCTYFVQVVPQYPFTWAVNDHYVSSHYGHQEDRDGGHTRGSYFVSLPDGRVQKVTYAADEHSRFVATVSYEREDAILEDLEPSYFQADAQRPSPPIRFNVTAR